MSVKAKKEITSWEEVYQLPIKYDGYNYCWSKNGGMALQFDDVVSEEDRQKIVLAINGEIDKKIKGLTIENEDFFIDGVYAFCVRGWGNLTGIGALNLSNEKAVIIQDGFINHILKSVGQNF